MENPSLTTLKTLYQESSNEILEHFFKFLSFKSISSEESYQPEMQKCVNWLKAYVEEIGFRCELWPTSGHPVLYAHWDGAGPDQPTLLIYNHYDVQPIDPIEEWESPPFDPTIRHGNIYARGAQDNKGQCFYVLQALKLLMKKNHQFPLNIKLCIEGEEECGSHGLSGVLSNYKEQLKADYLAVVDLGIPAPNQPALTLGLRGLTTMDVEVTGSTTDLHSGSHGGIVYNPIHALVEILSQLRDANGKIQIPGFYDDIVELSANELNLIDRTFDTTQYEALFGAKSSGGEKTFSPHERNWLRPTLEINGISGGYSGTGFKTVIPAKAHAKISCRLVPHQDPLKTAQKVADFIESLAPEGITVKVHIHTGKGSAVRSPIDSDAIKAFKAAYEEVYQTPCGYTFSGASIPIVTELTQVSGGELVLLGIGLSTDCIHAPNEHFGIDRLEKGSLIIARGIENLTSSTRS